MSFPKQVNNISLWWETHFIFWPKKKNQKPKKKKRKHLKFRMPEGLRRDKKKESFIKVLRNWFPRSDRRRADVPRGPNPSPCGTWPKGPKRELSTHTVYPPLADSSWVNFVQITSCLKQILPDYSSLLSIPSDNPA